jgi:3-oxoacyl-[acyl-carrier-protein] synthase-1
MIPVYAIASNIVSTLGLDTAAHWQAALSGKIGIRQYSDEALSATPFYGARIDPAQWQIVHESVKAESVLSPFEEMCIFSARQGISDLEYSLDPNETVFILSTTKGNIEWLGKVPDERILLTSSAKIIAAALGISAKPVVVSQACVSGVLATQLALRLLQGRRYKHAIVIGADRFTRFVLSGFQSFQAVADGPCRPFDAQRNGINLGEAAATIIFSSEVDNPPLAQLISGSTSNDANHISGPSRTGEELALAIQRSLEQSGRSANDINMISAHGTATLYNDEMESKAFGLLGLAKVPVHSFKGYLGHTLGAAGVVESAMIIESLQKQQLISSAGFTALGVPIPLNVTTAPLPAKIDYVLKTASGFGGSNAAAVWGKV